MKTLRSLASRLKAGMAFCCPSPAAFPAASGELAGATTRQAGLRQRLPGKAGLGWAGPAREARRSLSSRREATLAPLPRHPRARRERWPWGAALASAGSRHFAVLAETLQRGTRRCKLNGRICVLQRLQKLVPPLRLLHLPQLPRNSGDPQD